MKPYFRHVTAILVAWFLVGMSNAPAQNHSGGIATPESGEEYSHLMSDYPKVRTPWIDISADRWGASWVYLLTVNSLGDVVHAVFETGAKEQREEAASAARSLKFKPFERNGRAVPVRFRFTVQGEPLDYRGPHDRTFNLGESLANVVIALRRTACFGTCPDYRVEIRSDGQVIYHGSGFVLVTGTHQWRIPQEAVTRLIELIRRADYFKLEGYYRLNATDLPTYITRVSVGSKDKFVLDYGGSGMMGDVAASTSFGGPSPNMPSVVSEIEDAIDQAADDASWVKGDEKTISRLEEAHWNFQSRSAGQTLSMLIADCNSELARQFLAKGAPVGATGRAWFGGSTPASAAHCADPELVRELIAKGSLKGLKEAKAFLLSSVASGNPEMVSIALEHFRNVDIKDGDGKPLISVAADPTPRNEGQPVKAIYDPAKVISMLVAKGADANARDTEGNTALFEASSEDVVRELIRAGADPNARDSKGQTPLFDYFAETKKALLEAGADVNVRDKFGRTALFDQNSAEAVRILIAAGVDVNATANSGHTALDAVANEEIAMILLKAGAKLPTDGDPLEELIKRATTRNWQELLAILKAGTRVPGAQ